MAKDEKAEKPAKPAEAKGDKPAKEKKEKPAKDAAAAAAAPAAEAKPAKAPEPPRPPADPRLKVMKKFRGRFLPKGPLRDRLKAIQTKWDSGDDHGGVTLEELKSLHAAWKASREKKSKKPATA
jgi:hypothetical protein